MNHSDRKLRIVLIEKIGVTLSVLCAIHCLSMPLFLFFAPYFLTSFAFNSFFEWVLVILSFGLAAILLVIDYLKHRQPLPLYFLALAVFLKFIDILIADKNLEWIFGLLLGISVGIAYWVNYKHKVACTCKLKA